MLMPAGGAKAVVSTALLGLKTCQDPHWQYPMLHSQNLGKCCASQPVANTVLQEVGFMVRAVGWAMGLQNCWQAAAGQFLQGGTQQEAEAGKAQATLKAA